MNDYIRENQTEIEEKYSKAQQELIDKFKAKLEKAANDTIGSLYCDISPWATTDAHTNYHNYLKDIFRQSLVKEISNQHGMYSWAYDIRMMLLKQYKEELQNKIIQDLQEQVERMGQEIKQLYERRF